MMSIGVLAVGRLKNGPEQMLLARYEERVVRSAASVGMRFGGIRELPESRARDSRKRKHEETEALFSLAGTASVIIALDEKGQDLSSHEFADLLARYRDEGRRDLFCLVGGADGLDRALLSRAAQSIRLGRMTWPHQFVRLMVIEQYYRAMTILAGHPYHRQ